MKKKYYYGCPVVVFGWSTQTGDDGFEWNYTKFPNGTSPEEGKEYPLSEVWDKGLVFDGIHRDNQGGTSEIEVHYLDKTAYEQEGKWICYIVNSFVEGNEFKLSNGYTKDDVHYQFDKTKSYLIRRNGCSGPPKVVFIYKNESGENCCKVVTVQEIRSEVNSVTENKAKLTHYHFGDWYKVDAHYELVGNIYKVDSVSDTVVTFPKQVTEFNEYYLAELVPNKYRLSLNEQLFFNTTDLQLILVNNMAKLGEFDLLVSADETKIYAKTVNGDPNYCKGNDFAYKSNISVSFYFPISDYTPYLLLVISAADNSQYDSCDLVKDNDNTYTTSFEMPGLESSIKILFTKNDTTN